MTNLEKVTSTIETAEEVTRKIWLAGLGAYGKSFEEILSKYEKLNGERARLFEGFVAKGEKIAADTNENVSEVTSETFKETARVKTAVDKRVEEVRKKLGLDMSDTEAKISQLSQKIDALTVLVNKLSYS
jgi:poly(hydroxyalkanoate) granule-associated protein